MKKATITSILSFTILAAAFGVFSPAHAQVADTANSIIQAITPTPNTAEAAKPEDKDKESKKEDKTTTTEDATPAKTESASSTPVTATTTPQSGSLGNGDPYNSSIEKALNTTITPKPTPKATTTTPVTAAPKKTTTTTQPAKTTTTQTSKKSAATTTPVAGTTQDDNTSGTAFSRLIDGESNVAAPANYYVPLDTLSPEATYILSFIAMLIGVFGAILILKEPRTAPLWVPGLRAQESLLE